MVLRMFGELRHCSRLDILFAIRALDDVATPAAVRLADPERVKRSLRGLRTCQEDLGLAELPSKGQYEGWFKQQGKAKRHPSATYISNTFERSWAKAREAAGAPPTPRILARRALGNGSRFTSEELVELLTVCAQDLRRSDLTFEDYRVWAERELAEPSGRFQRVAISRPTFRHGGGWNEVLHKAGLKPAPRRGGRALVNRPRGLARAYTRDEMLRLLQEAAAACPTRLTCTFYDKFRRAAVAQAQAEGRALPTVASGTISGAFGSWADALHAAGLIDEATRRQRAGLQGKVLTEEDALAALHTAIKQLGPDLRRNHYRRWRRVQLDRSPQACVPSDLWLTHRFGSWSAGVQAALDAGAPPADGRTDEDEGTAGLAVAA
jgi:hypothetical protein